MFHVMTEIMLIFSAQYRKIVTSFEFTECYGSDEQSRKLIYERSPHVICFCNYQMLHLNMLAYSNYAEFSKYYGR
jgi:ATP-dependent helicase YprA (DUF1998 family)